MNDSLPVRWKYQWLHTQTKKTGTSETTPIVRREFLEALSNWNRRGSGVWVYWEA